MRSTGSVTRVREGDVALVALGAAPLRYSLPVAVRQASASGGDLHVVVTGSQLLSSVIPLAEFAGMPPTCELGAAVRSAISAATPPRLHPRVAWTPDWRAALSDLAALLGEGSFGEALVACPGPPVIRAGRLNRIAATLGAYCPTHVLLTPRWGSAT